MVGKIWKKTNKNTDIISIIVQQCIHTPKACTHPRQTANDNVL